MKVQVRRGVFETNSSSTHAIAVENYYKGSDILSLHHFDFDKLNDESKKRYEKFPFPDSVIFKPGEYGWEFATYTDANSKASYLITAMSELLDYDEFDSKIKDFNRWLWEEGITMVTPEYEKVEDEYRSTEKYKVYNVHFMMEDSDKDTFIYIDHCYGAEEFMCYVMSTKRHLFEYLFGDSIVKTGNDNSDTPVEFFETDEDSGYPMTDEGWDFYTHHKIFRKGN